MALRAWVLVGGVFCLAMGGCASPETLDSTPVKILAAVPGLTWVDGDPEAGTTTSVSLPLLSYRSSEEHPGYYDSATYVLPVIGRFAQTDRYVKLAWEDAPQGPPDEEGEAPPKRLSVTTSRDAERDKKIRPSARGRRAPRKRSASEARKTEAPRKRGRGAKRAKPRASVTSAGPRAERAEQERERERERRRRRKKRAPKGKPGGKAVVVDDKSHLVLTLPFEGEIVRQRPQQVTRWDLLGSLWSHTSTRRAEVVVRGDKRTAVYRVGEDRDEFRILPLFSFELRKGHTSWTAWPLLGIGYKRDGKKSALRLFYFIEIPLD